MDNSSVYCLIDCDYVDIFDEDSKDVFFIVYIILFCIFGWIGNTLVCYVILNQTSRRTPADYYLISLSASDGFLLFSVIWMALKKHIDSYLGSEYSLLCLLIYYMAHICSAWSSSTSTMVTLAFTLDRYIAICHPFLARSLTSQSRTVKTIVSLWIVSFVYITGMSLCYKRRGIICDEIRMIFALEFYLTAFYFIPMICNFVCYFLIAINIMKSARSLRSFGNQTVVRERGSNIRSLQISVAVVAECFICFMPMSIITLMQKHYDPYRNYKRKYTVYKIAYTLSLLSNVINPVLYLLVSREFRKSFWGVLCPTKGLSRTSKEKIMEHQPFNSPPSS